MEPAAMPRFYLWRLVRLVVRALFTWWFLTKRNPVRERFPVQRSDLCMTRQSRKMCHRELRKLSKISAPLKVLTGDEDQKAAKRYFRQKESKITYVSRLPLVRPSSSPSSLPSPSFFFFFKNLRERKDAYIYMELR